MMRNVLMGLDKELFRLYDIKNRLELYEWVGCDVGEYISVIDLKIDELTLMRRQSYKFYLIERGDLPVICFNDCEYNCLDCIRIKEYHE